MGSVEELGFKWQDYVVLTSVLVISAGIGFFYACTGGKQRTTKEYLLADKNMHWFPVAASLLSSYISSQTSIGVPGEIYTFGTVYVHSCIGIPFAIIIALNVFLPVFKQLEVTSVYEYIEMRFGRALRLGGLLSNCLGTLFYMSLVIYGPALAFAAVTGVNLWLSVLSVAIVAIFYTVLLICFFNGGMKAVLWTDTVQMIFMFGGLLAVLIVGFLREGGMFNVWEANLQSGRLDFLVPEKVFDFDPRMRHTFWNQIFVGLYVWSAAYATNQGSVQRALTLKLNTHFKLLSISLVVVLGYHQQLGATTRRTPTPLFLSTISTGLCSLSTTILQDIVRPLKPDITERQATRFTKIMSIIFGVMAIGLVVIAKYFGTGVMSLGTAISGMTGGPAFAVFTLGVLVPIANSKGVIVGFLIGSAWIMTIGLGSIFNSPFIYEYPVTTDGCNMSSTDYLYNISAPQYDPSTWDPYSHYRSGVEALFDISYAWNGTSGYLVTFVFSIIASYLFGNKNEPLIHKSLLTPLFFKCDRIMPKAWMEKVDYTDKEIPVANKSEKNKKLLEEAEVDDKEFEVSKL